MYMSVLGFYSNTLYYKYRSIFYAAFDIKTQQDRGQEYEICDILGTASQYGVDLWTAGGLPTEVRVFTAPRWRDGK